MNDEGSAICRCEEIDTATVRAAVAAGARTINDVKRRTRAGMGLCQGAYCVGNVARVLHEVGGVPLDQIPPMTARPPVRPIPLDEMGELA